MATIDDLYQAFSNVHLREELPMLVLDNGAEMGRLVETQLIKGKLSTGESIIPSYANKYYSKKKNAMNSTPGYGVPDLKYSGDYYRGIGVALKSDTEYDIESDVEYALNDNITQYGDDLLRLSEENKGIFAQQFLLPAIGNYIEEKTGLKFT